MTVAIASVAVVLLIVIDQLTKYWAHTSLMGGDPLTVIDGFLQFRYVENTGAAFGIFSDNTALLSVFTMLMIVGVVCYLFISKEKDKLQLAAWGFIIAGGIGNLIDRTFRHFVVDFIEFTFVDYAVFNFADCCVTVGAALLIIAVIADMVREHRHQGAQEESTDE